MKKILILMIVCIMTIGILNTNIFAANADNGLGGYIYTKDMILGTHFSLSSQALATRQPCGEDGEMRYFTLARTKSGGYTTFKPQDDNDILGMNLNDYPVFVAKLKLDREFISENGYFAVQINDKASNKVEAPDMIQSTTEWQTLVLDLSELSIDYVETFKVYYLKNPDISTYIRVTFDYFAFFETEEQANVLKNTYNGDLAAYINGDNEGTPATQAPATQAPATQAPATQAPTTQAPTTQAPATQAPTTQAPATDVPGSDATQAPITEAPKKDGGCGSSSAIAQVMLILGAALIIKKRK